VRYRILIWNLGWQIRSDFDFNTFWVNFKWKIFISQFKDNSLFWVIWKYTRWKNL